ncbi:MAG: hypothetical protein WD316_12205 [Phycisphaeraceae bacterium]
MVAPASGPHAQSKTPAPAPAAAPAANRGEISKPSTGLVYSVARSLADIEAAWGLVYRAYMRSGLISPNPARLHTQPQAVGPHTMVVAGRIGPVAVSTLSAYLDTEAGLPLDAVYPDEMRARRDAGRKLAEGGLFADRRARLTRSADSLFDLMRFVVLFAYCFGADDLMIGVHPRHAPFYRRFLGFEVAGPEKSYSVVNDNPVVLMEMNLAARFADEPRRRGIAYFEQHPLTADDFAQRYTFPPAEVEASALGEFLQMKPA